MAVSGHVPWLPSISIPGICISPPCFIYEGLKTRFNIISIKNVPGAPEQRRVPESSGGCHRPWELAWPVWTVGFGSLFLLLLCKVWSDMPLWFTIRESGQNVLRVTGIGQPLRANMLSCNTQLQVCQRCHCDFACPLWSLQKPRSLHQPLSGQRRGQRFLHQR